MRLRMMVATVAMGVCCAMASAQMGTDASAEKVGTVMTPAKSLDELLSLFESEAMGVAKAMPADKYSFAPSAATFAPGQGAKFDGVRSFGSQAVHLASANYFFYSVVGGMKPDVDMKTLNSLTKKEDIVKALAESFAFAHKAIATITTENAFVTIKGIDGMHTRVSLAAFGPAHGYDHYGQMVEYLRMNGVVPPGSK